MPERRASSISGRKFKFKRASGDSSLLSVSSKRRKDLTFRQDEKDEQKIALGLDVLHDHHLDPSASLRAIPE